MWSSSEGPESPLVGQPKIRSLSQCHGKSTKVRTLTALLITLTLGLSMVIPHIDGQGEPLGCASASWLDLVSQQVKEGKCLVFVTDLH